jgi:hypothetical protein
MAGASQDEYLPLPRFCATCRDLCGILGREDGWHGNCCLTKYPTRNRAHRSIHEESRWCFRVGFEPVRLAVGVSTGDSQMKKQIALGRALVMFLACCLITFVQQAAQSQSKQSQTVPSLTDTQRNNVLEYIDLLRTDVQGQKAEIMGALMGLGVGQSAKFWPIYGQYDAELTRLNTLRASNIQDYTRNYYQLTDPKADKLAQNSLDYRRQRSDILARCYGRMKDSLGAVEAMRFLQIEGQLLAIIDLQTASALPGPIEQQPPPTPTKVQTQAAPTRVTVPAGTRILIRMVDSVDSSKQETGYRFTARLETNLQVGDVVVAPRGTTVYGRLAKAKSAGNMSGGAELALELTDIVIAGTAYPLLTSNYQVTSQGQGNKTARRIVGGTGLGALVGGLAGGGKGAAIGAGAGAAAGTTLSAATKGKQVSVSNESLVEFRLQQPVSLPVAR